VKFKPSQVFVAVAAMCFFAGALEVYDRLADKDAEDVPLQSHGEDTRLPLEPASSPIAAETIDAPNLPVIGSVHPATPRHVTQAQAKQAQTKRVTLKAIRFDGVKLLSDMELKELVARYIGVPMTHEQMLDITKTVESYYRRNNFLARVIPMSQHIKNGVLRVEVIESELTKAAADKALAPVPKSGTFANADTQYPHLARTTGHDLPVVTGKGALSQDAAIDEAAYVLTHYKNRSRQLELMADNGGARETGTARVSVAWTWFDLHGLSDLLNIVASHTQGSDYARLAYRVPVGSDGWRLGIHASALNYQVLAGESAFVGTIGRAMSQGIDWLLPVHRADAGGAVLKLSAEQRKFHHESALGVLSDQQTKALAAQISGAYRDLGSKGVAASYVLKLEHGDVASSLPLDPLKPIGAFTKVRVNASLEKSLSPKTSAYVAYRAQHANRKLDTSEQMALGGPHGVRAYPVAEGLGSHAQLVQLELRHQLAPRLGVSGFYDVGQSWGGLGANGVNVGERNTYKGFGASLGYTYGSGVQVRATWARRHGANPNPTSSGHDQDGSHDRDRYWLQLNLPF
jgi:hemolysin activation/secretion protein